MQYTPTGQRDGVQAIARAAAVLRVLESEPEGMALTDLASAVELPKSTVHRLARALADEELVTIGSGADIRLGPGLARLGAASRMALRHDVRPVLESLNRELDETVDLAVLEGSLVKFVDQIPAPHRLRAVSVVGAAFPLYCTANGKALLAALPQEEVLARLPPRLTRFTANTITSRAGLLAELERVRGEGVAVDREEHTEGISAVGAVVHDAAGVAAAISVPVPTARFIRHEGLYARAVRAAAEEASQLAGGRH